MLKACKCFNFMLPYEKYEKLKDVSRQENDLSIAEIIRRGIDIILNNYEGKKSR